MSVYYKEKPIWLKESIESMLSQTVKAEEFFIVKDGPLTDELDEVIDGYVKNYPELFTICGKYLQAHELESGMPL